MAEVQLGSLYELNQQLSNQMPVLNEVELGARWYELKEWFQTSVAKYAMLLCHDQRDYTLFANESQTDEAYGQFASDLFECLKNRGGIVSIDPADGNAWEIWIRINNGVGEEDNFNDYCYFLFNYDAGVIEV